MSHNGQKLDSHDQGNGSADQEHPVHPLDNVFSQSSQEGPILQMQTGLFHLGHNRALLSGAVAPEAEHIRSLEEHARSIARDTYREQFDPKKHAHDRMHLEEFERLKDRRDEIERGVAHAQANVRDAEKSLALMPKAGPKPEASPWLAAAFVVAISITVAPTLHDLIFFTIPDQLLSWFASATCAAFVAFMVTTAILMGRRTKWTRAGEIGGIAVGLGLGIVRLASAQNGSEALFAIGLTVVEVSAVALLGWLARGLSARETEWQVIRIAEDKAAATRDAEIADLHRRKGELQEVTHGIQQRIAYVEDRANRCVLLPELEGVAVKAVLDGYNAGIAENLGRIRSASRRNA